MDMCMFWDADGILHDVLPGLFYSRCRRANWYHSEYLNLISLEIVTDTLEHRCYSSFDQQIVILDIGLNADDMR